LGVQIVDESDQLAFGFDLLDPTKIIPQEIVPVTPLGKMQLNRNPKNFFAETKQIMVCYLQFTPNSTDSICSFNQLILSVVSISLMTPYSKAGSSPTLIRNSTVTGGPISSSYL
jgi:hypothetical protein